VSAVAVELTRVGKRYGGVVAVRDVTLRIEPGRFCTLLGPSGCGKTTTLRMIAGLELPSEGTIAIGGRDVTGVPAAERDVAMVFQSYALFPHMTVLENVGYGLRARGASGKATDERARAALGQVDLPGVEGRMPGELSGGQQQRVALARAVVLEPRVLLFDEPLSNLDARLRRQVRGEIRAIQRRLGVTAIWVTHDQEEALAISDEVVVMDRAVVVQQGSPRELFERPATAFVARFLGESNLLPALARRVDGHLEVTLGSLTLAVPTGPEGDVMLAVRPDAVRIERDRAAAGLPGRIARATYVGRAMEYVIETELGALHATCVRVDAPLAEGADVRVALAPGPGVAVVRRGD
jgi:iron(III) transport system ATP-binding protein